ncbi:hypothetical protein ACJMK2_008689 [Sinanodonta woodiana]|uniref:DH domain-containing protein n=1 Tax=Sinanodonta woodiana TaxID=1069815 RepID=A0ABD3VNM5_SINWO
METLSIIFRIGDHSDTESEKDGEALPPSGSQSLSKATGAKVTGGKSQNSKNSKAGGSLRSRRGINLSIDESIFPMSLSASVSPQGTIRENDSRKTKGQNKLTNLFSPLSKDKEKQDQLSEILNGYSINGLPSPPSLLQIGQPRFNEEVFNIEPHWSSLVDNASALTKRQHDQQEAIWELLQTELHYIQSLRVIADLFLCVLLNIQNQMLLNEIETEKLLSNIGEITNCNSIFWEMYLCKVVQQSRTYRSPLNPSLIKEGFKKFPELFHPYINYCSYQKSCQEYMKVQYSDNDLFKMFVIWAETQKQCNRLKLSDLLVKPMQRLTKYSLLLQAILRKTDDDIQRKDLLEMIASVDKFVTFVNSTLRKQHEEERLQTIADKIETYDAVDAPNDECLKIIQQYNGNFNLLAPMQGCNPEEIRSLIMQSALKMKDNQSRMDVECLLFTDLLLICKSNKRMDKYKILKPPMRVDRVLVHEIKDKGSFLLIYINEYHVPVSSFTFHADQASVRVWTEHIRKAQTMYHEARQRAIQNLDQPQYLGTEIVEEQVIGYHPLVMPDNPPQLHLTHCDSFESHRDGNLEALITLEGSETESHLNRSRSWNDMEITVDNSSSNSDSKGDYSPLPSKKHKVVQYSNSEPSILKPGEERLQVPSVHSQSLYDESLPDIMDENLRMKLNQRRTSRTEKRYYTADAVQEIQRQEGKDTSIYKRLSWNFGTGEQTSEKDNIIRSRIQSSDSLRSVHSSSGVSSTGSLHLSPEGDICEDIILESDSQDKGVDNNEDSSETESTLDRLNEDDYKPSYLIPSVRQSRSKSTSDIVALIQEMSTGDLKDGISSVDLPKTEVQKMKLSHSELMRMTKKLILSSSDIEASEV